MSSPPFLTSTFPPPKSSEEKHRWDFSPPSLGDRRQSGVTLVLPFFFLSFFQNLTTKAPFSPFFLSVPRPERRGSLSFSLFFPAISFSTSRFRAKISPRYSLFPLPYRRVIRQIETFFLLPTSSSPSSSSGAWDRNN